MAARPARFLGGDVYRRPAFGDNHPLSIPRVGLVMELCEALGWFDDDVIDSPMASIDDLARFHDPDYIAAVRRVSADGKATVEDRDRFNLGTRENPVFDGLEARARTSCGGSILAAGLAMQGYLAFNPAGGTHHGLRDRAHGFCYFNDPVMAILTLLARDALPVLYVDLDAHHGDGVEMAFADDGRVTTVSIHEQGRWPNTGVAHGPDGSGIFNFPVPRGFHDDELAVLINDAVLPLAARLSPRAVVITCGADGLAGDPLSGMYLSNVGLWRAVMQLIDVAPHTVVLGGGGYNPWTVARCWAGLWGCLSGRTPPWPMPDTMRERFMSLDCDLVDEEDREEAWFNRLDDEPTGGDIRAEVRTLAASIGRFTVNA